MGYSFRNSVIALIFMLMAHGAGDYTHIFQLIKLRSKHKQQSFLHGNVDRCGVLTAT
ncbi:hypothetical protein VSWAT3_07261 [Vibrionales bacterium SWAT-3]|nr:hypothetical protein VSWAT3_07261 [Vibrionales bacterium SWAT-3]